MATNNKVKNVVLGVTAVSTVVAGAYWVTNNVLYKERDYSDVLVESAKKYVENNNISIDSKLVTSAARLKDTNNLVSKMNDECVNNSFVTITNEDGTYKYEPSLSCEPTNSNDSNAVSSNELSYTVMPSSTKLTNGNVEIQVVFSEKIQNVNAQGWILSSDKLTLTKIFSANGEESFEVLALNSDKKTTVSVSASNIDKDAPVILVNGKSVLPNYGTDVNLNVVDDNLASVTVNGEEMTDSSIKTAGEYEVVATDKAGNKARASFSLGRSATTAPVINRIKDGGVYTTLPLIITFSDGQGVLDGNIPFESSNSVTTPGSHTLTVTNEIGSTTVNFIIDPTDPEVWVEAEDGSRVADGRSTNKNVKVYFRDDYSSVTAKSNNLYRDLYYGEEFTEEGTYTITVTDGAGHTVTHTFTINKKVPTVDGVADGKVYSNDRTITFDDKNGTVTVKLNGEEISSGKVVSEEKKHILEISDDAGNSGTLEFTIDKTAPSFVGIPNDLITKDDVTVEASDATLKAVTVNGAALNDENKKLTEDGVYTLVAIDEAGFSTTRTVTIDKTAPVVEIIGTKLAEGIYSDEVTFTISDLTATTVTLNGNPFEGTENKITKSGKHTLVVTDAVGLETVKEFTITKDIPEVTLVSGDKEILADDETVTHYFNQDVTIRITENALALTATLNGESLKADEIANGKVVKAVNKKHNEYELIVSDSLGRTATIHFVIDKKSPTSSVMSHAYNKDMLIHVEDESGIDKILLDGKEIENDTVTLSVDGSYRLQIVDKSGNSVMYYPTIDKTAPQLTFEVGGETILVDDLTKKLYFAGALKVSFADATFVEAKIGEEIKVDKSDRLRNGSLDIEGDGEYALAFTDNAGNVVNVTVVIDTKDPIASISYENIDDEATPLRVDSVKMLLTVDEEISFVDSNGYLWLKLSDKTEDGKYQYVYTVSQTTSGTVTVTDAVEHELAVPYAVNIDKTAPNGFLKQSETAMTNKSITMTLVVDEEVTITDSNEKNVWMKLEQLTEDGKYQYSMLVENNMKGSIAITDANGNSTSLEYDVTNIDKTVDIKDPEYTYTDLTEAGYTNKDVVISMTATEPVTIVDSKLTWTESNVGGVYTYTTTATENIVNTIEVTDSLGNKKSVSYEVTVIEKDAPVVEGLENGIYLSETDTYLFNTNILPTFDKGTAVLTRNFINEDGTPGQEIVDDFKSGSTISKDGVYTLVVTDRANNVTTKNIIVDKTKPTATVTADVPSDQFTKGPVILTVKTSEPVTMITESSALKQIDNQTWTFKKSINGTITFKFSDAAGNVGIARYTVENIDKVKPTVEGIDQNGIYNENKNVTFADNNPGVTATLNGESFAGGEISDGKHVLIVTDAAGNTITYRFTIDTVDPVITGVIDGGLYNKNIKPSFNEGTAVLTKKVVGEDGSITDEILTYAKGDVLTEDGIYTLTVTDAAGNDTAVTFTIDKTVPTAEVTPDVPVGKYTNGAVILTVKTSEPVEMLTSNSALTKIDDQTWEFKKGINGTISFKFKDAAGNIGTISYTVDNIDKTKPVITGVENKGIYNAPVNIQYSDDHNVTATLDGEYLGSGETIDEDGKYTLVVTDEATNTVTYTFTIDMTPPEVTGVVDGEIYNKNVKPSFNEGTGVLTKKVTNEDGTISDVIVADYKKGASITEDGEYTLTVTDGANNSTVVNFTIDKTKPVATITPDITDPTNGPVILTIKMSEPVEMLTENKALTKKDDQTWTFKKSINGTITFKFVDAAGNVGSARYTVENIDKDKPEGTISYDNTEATKEDVTITLTVNEPIKDLSESDWKLVKDATEDDNSVVYEKTVTENTNGEVELTYTDLAGNAGKVTYTVGNIDKTAATVGVSYSTTEDTKNDVTITLNATEQIKFTDSKLSWTETANEDGSYTYTATATENVSNTFTAEDHVGNETVVTYTVGNIDKTAATVTVTYSTTDDTNQNVTITLNATEQITFTDSKLSWTETANEDGSYTYTATATENVSNTFTAEDHVGNETEVTYTVGNIDKTAATVTVSYSDTNSTNQAVTITLNATEQIKFTDSKLSWTETANADGSYTYTATATENVSNTFTAKDHVGNETEVTYTVGNIDKDAPVITIPGGNVIVVLQNGAITLPTVTATDAVDGEVEVTSNGTIDTANTGEQTITYTASDAAGNTATETLTVIVLNTKAFDEKVKDMNDLVVEGNWYDIVVDNKFNYTDESWAARKEVIDDLRELLASTTIPSVVEETPIQEYIDDVVSFLDTVYALEKKPVNSDEYDKLVTRFNALADTKDDYDENSYEAIVNMIRDHALDQTVYTLQSEFNKDRYAPLYNAIEDLVAHPLEVKFEYSHNYLEMDYSGYTAFETELGQIRADIDNGTITLRSVYKQRIEAAEEALLKTRLPIDDSAFKALLKDLEDNYDEDDYTDASWAALQEKIAAVQAVIDAKGLRSEYKTEFDKINLDDLVKLPKVTSYELKTSGNEGYAKLGDRLTVVFESNVELTLDSTPDAPLKTVVTINGKVATLSKNSETGKYEAYIIVGEDDDEGQSYYTITPVGPNQLVGEEFWEFTGLEVDMTPATATIMPSTGGQTVGPVILTLTPSEEIIITSTTDEWTRTEGKNEYTLSVTENRTVTVEFTDLAGNASSKTFKVGNIDSVDPTAEIAADITEATNQDVVLTLTPSEEIIITSTTDEWTRTEDKNEYTLTVSGNRTVTVTFKDLAGRTGEASYTVDNIDKTAATVTVTYSTTDDTNQNVTITLNATEQIEFTDSKLSWTETANVDGSYTYTATATENVSNTFTATDHVGNETEVTYTVGNIDKTAATVTVTYSTTDDTNQNVTITLNATEQITFTDNKLTWTETANADGSYTYTATATENVSNTFTAEDHVGNETEVTYTVGNIDKTAATVTVTYSTTDDTNQNVTITLNATEQIKFTDSKLSWTETANEDGSYTYTATATENVSNMFIATDHVGNETEVTYTVGNIDKTAATVTVTYSTTDDTNQNVTITLNATEQIEFTDSKLSWTETANADGSYTYTATATENVSNTFTATDHVGNETEVTYTVGNIDKTAATATVSYSTTESTNGSVIITLTSDKVVTFTDSKLEWSDVKEENGKFVYTATATENVTNTLTLSDHVGNETEVTYTVGNIDKDAPVITIPGENVIVTIKDKDVTYPTVTATDAVDGEVEVSQDMTSVDVSELGDHVITYTASDAAGNTATVTLTIRVLDASRFITAKNRILTLENNAQGWELLNENMYDYTSKSWSDLMMWYDSVNYLIGEDEIHLNHRFTQTMLDQYIDYVVNALDALVPATINYGPYNAIIEKIDNLVESDYSAESWAELMTKKAESETGIKLQSDANYFTKELTAYVDSLVKKPVKDTTSEIFNKYLEEDYSGFTAYQKALTELSADVNEGILQSEYDRRIKEIEDTMVATKLPIDDSAFKALLKDLEDNYNEKDYTEESWAALQTKIEAVQTIINNEGLRSEYRIELEKINLKTDLVLIPKVTTYELKTSGNEGYAKPGDTLTVEFESNVELDMDSTIVTINGKTASKVEKNAEGKYTAYITVSETDNEGQVYYTVAPVDLNGLSGEEFWNFTAIVVDVTPANGNISYSTTDDTNKDVTIALTVNEEITEIVDSNGKNWMDSVEGEYDLDGNFISATYRLTVSENITGTLTIKDKAGNVTSDIEYRVGNIDKTPATVGVSYSTTEATNQNVTITLNATEQISFTDNKLSWTENENADGSYTYTATATENVSNTFTAVDHVGNETTVSYSVSNIDKIPANVTVSYTHVDKELTNEDVTITITSDKELSVINDTNNMNWFDNTDVRTDANGKKSYIYSVTVSENKSGKLTVEDAVGNTTEVEYEVKNIDKVKPNGVITYVTGALGSETSIEGDTDTNQDVTIKLTSDKELVEIVDSNGKNWMESVEVEIDFDGNFVSATYRLTVSENTAGTLTIKDKAGNVVEGIEYNVSGIDKVAPEAVLIPSTTEMTNKDVTLSLNVTGNEEVTIKESNVSYELVDGKYVFTVTENTNVSVTIADHVGNETVVTLNVENIDKVAPKLTVTSKETGKTVGTGAYVKGALIVSVNEGSIFDNGKEVADGTEITEDGVHRLQAKDAAGNVTQMLYIGIDNTAPVVSGVEESGIYDENGVTITATDATRMTTTIDGKSYTLGENYAVDGHHTLVVTDKVGNETTVEFDIVVNAPTIDIDGEQTNGFYTGAVTVNVTGAHIDAIKNGDEAIENGARIANDGTYTITATDKAGHTATVTFTIDTKDPEIGGFEDGKAYSTSITVTLKDANSVSATLADGTTVEDGQEFTEDGTYEITAVDAVGHSVTKSFTIDKVPPVVTGVEDGQVYTDDVTVDFNKGTATVNGDEFESGSVLSDGKYDLVVTSPAGLETKISFIVDTKTPEINGFEDGRHYASDVTVNVVDDNIVYIKKNGEEIENGSTFSSDGVYEITTKDVAGREVTKTFTIDKTFPTITLSGTGKNGLYSTDVTIAVEDTNISTIVDANGNTVASDATFNTNGTYTIIATDLAGNETTATFTIDKEAPVVTGVEDGQVYGENVTVSFDKGTATLNDNSFANNTPVSDGKYVLVVTGENGLSTTINFTVDTVAPNITSIENGKVYGSDVKVEFNDAMTRPSAKLDGNDVSNGYVETADGTHTLVVTDEAGNSTTVTFTIDKTAPVLEITDNKGVKHTEDFEMEVEADKNASFDGLAYNVSDRGGVDVEVGIDGIVKLAELGNYTLTYTAKDDVGNKKTITVTVKVKDTTAPVINMAGAEVIEVKYGSNYTEPTGTTATDAFEGELEVTRTGNVDIYSVGDYEITYTAKDSSGNTTTQKRTVKVVKTTTSQLFRDANGCSDGSLCYSTVAKNNYVWYSGHLWRVVRINADNTLRLVTDDAVSGFSFDDNSSAFAGSNAEKWLNNVFYPSLNNASSIVATGEFCNEKLTSRTKVRYTCSPSSVVKSNVGLLTIDEYNILGGKAGFLNNGDHYFTMTPSSEDTTWVVKYDGEKEIGYYVNEPYAMRPVININEIDVVSGKGTASEPFRIAGDNSGSKGSNLTTRSSGEYVNFGGKTWRVVSSSNEGTKLIADNYLTTNDGYVKVSFGTVGTFNTSTGIGQYLNSTVYNGFSTKEKSVIKLSRWYNNKYAIGQNPMDTTLINGSSYTDAYVGLIRVGELMSGSTSTNRVDRFTYWTLNSANQNTWFISWGGTSEYSSPSDLRGVRPVITLDKTVKIASGNGTASSPYELEY